MENITKQSIKQLTQSKMSKVKRSLVSAKELQIIKLMMEGLTSAEIAVILKRSVKTIDVHRYNAMSKLKANNAAHLISTCYQEGLLTIDKK